MARFHVDIDAVNALKDSVERFQYQQHQVLVSAKHEIDTARESLDRKAEKWERELRDRQYAFEECQLRATAAAYHGEWIDCTSLGWAVDEAEELLANVHRWQAYVEGEVAAYEGERHRFQECVDVDILHARQYLRDIIETLSAARATQIHSGP